MKITRYINADGGIGYAGASDENEFFALKGDLFYMHAPEGIGRSKLFARFEKELGVEATTRNWRSIRKIFEMAVQSD